MFDKIIITAANAAQARGYRAQLKGRAGFEVVADPGGKRVGSLGATVNVLRHLPRLSGKVLICHSGGDARRIPGYAAMGKAFVPMADGRSMLDHIIGEVEKIAADGVTICCGDVILYLDYSKVKLADHGVTGVAYPDGPWQAQRHGVYVAEGAADGELVAVKDFLQKPQVKRGKFLIDTGIMHIDWETAAKMRKLPIAGDIYEEFPKQLLDGFADFSVSVVDRCDFFHIGSSRELLEKLGRKGRLVDGVEGNALELAGDNIVTNVPRSYGKICLAKGECLTSLPIGKNEWYHLKYRIDDNFKADGLWEKHGLGELMPKVNHGRLLKLRAQRPRSVRVTAPVRIDFAGGWSDTPPICNAEGGTVLTGAVRLDGERPISVNVRERQDNFVKVVSEDLGLRRLIKSAAEIDDHHDPHDWCCLVKSALAVTGFKFGKYGIDITIAANLPKGSGMGTSSILGAATIAALLAYKGEIQSGALNAEDCAKVGELTLALEAEMRTGGGWEDQFGGMMPGVKILRSTAGAKQRIAVESVFKNAAEGEATIKRLQERSLLYFTGQKRMARNVLRRVLGFYAENPHNFGKILISAVKADAERAFKALRAGDIDTFADCVNGYWRDKKLLDAGSTNERVEEIIDKLEGHVSAVSLAGAGGGGFMYILAKTPSEAKKIRKMLEANPPSKYSRFYDFSIDSEGLSVEL